MNETSSHPPPDPLDALFAAARAQRPDTSRAEYAFETRLMAHLRERPQPDPISLWSKMSWRMAPIFAACVVALALWQADLASETNDAALAAGLNNTVAGDFFEN
jgi:anti-sigma-K factor RskA